MQEKTPFFRQVCALAVPAALQSMLQSSFSIVDQIMIGQLGDVTIAGVGLAGKFSSIFTVIIAAVGAVAGIMLSQYIGQDNGRESRRSLTLNLWLGLGVAALFTALCGLFPAAIMGLYATDGDTVAAAASYLRIVSATFLPMAGATILSTLFRCAERPKLPLYAAIAAALMNTGLNYVLIFGKLGLPAMGAEGAAIATAVSQWVNLLVLLALLPKGAFLPAARPEEDAPFNRRQYLQMLLPMLVCEVLWSLGENVYAAIYGHMSTAATTAMTLMNPVQGLVIGALCGLSQAAGVIVGKLLGQERFEDAYAAAKRLLWYGLIGAVALGLVVAGTASIYVKIYLVEDIVRELTRQTLIAYALVCPLKVLNMILGGGILRSGGQTRCVMVIDIIGTWGFGVPMGLLAAFVWQFPVPYVYFLLSLEEGVRFVISLVVLRRRKWMRRLEPQG